MATLLEVTQIVGGAMPLYSNYHMPSTQKGPHGEPSDMAVMMQAWHRMVGHLDAAMLQAAVLDAVSGSKFFPTPADVLASAAKIALPEKMTGLEAWGVVMDAIRAHGYYHGPGGGLMPGDVWEFEQPLIGRLVRDMGWAYLCQSEDMMADRAHFAKAYDAASARETVAARELPLVTAARSERAAQIMGETVKRIGVKS